MWKRLLKSLKLVVRTMPRDVVTRWNSTYRMLDFALKYREAIDQITGDRSAELRKLELDVAPSGAVMMGEMDEVDTVEMGVTVDMGKDGIVALGGMGTCEREAEVTARGVDSGGSDGSESTVLDGREEGRRDDDSTNVKENPGPNGDRDRDVR